VHNDPFLEAEDQKENQLNYKGFGPRLGALLIDGLFIGIPIAAVNFYNLTSLRSFALWLLIAVIAVAYKPIMEAIYGATWGKMLVYIKVVDYDGNKISPFQAILRSIFTIGQTLILIPIYFYIFNDAYLMEFEGFFNFNLELTERFTAINVISGISFMIISAELIALLLDQPYRRAIHDRIAKTYVVESE
jgi:uncharacterized RDD family membrane protein YckC